MYKCEEIRDQKTTLVQFGERLNGNFVPYFLSHHLGKLAGHKRWNNFAGKLFSATNQLFIWLAAYQFRFSSGVRLILGRILPQIVLVHRDYQGPSLVWSHDKWILVNWNKILTRLTRSVYDKNHRNRKCIAYEDPVPNHLFDFLHLGAIHIYTSWTLI